MEGICPRCHVRLDLPASGVYDCERCRARFEVALGSPRPLGAAPAGPGWLPPGGVGTLSTAQPWEGAGAEFTGAVLDPAVQAPCASHPGNPATHLCERCGDFMCRLCMTPVDGRLYCPRCFDLLYRRGALQSSHRQFTLPGITLGLGISAVLMSCACLGAPFGIGGVIAGMNALKEYRKRPELPGQKMTYWGLGLSVASLVITVITAIVLVARFFAK